MINIKKLALFVLMPVLVSSAAVADTHYVNPGESIQAAIDAAHDGDEIGVAPGIYIQAINFNGMAIRLYGIGGPDATLIDCMGCNHVVQCIRDEGPDTILEGFTITGGDRYEDGTGMYNLNSSPTVTNCTFSNNTANDGGGMYNYGGSPTVTNCTFTGNTSNEHGGGMYNDNASPTVINCTFNNNTAGEKGGGMYNDNSSPTVTDCTFSGNTADSGGGLYIELGSPTVTNCTFTGNTAMDLAGMGISQSSPTVTNCTFSGNTVERFGGGMGNIRSNSTVTNCTFTGNTTNYYGGGMFNDDCSPTITNCTFTDNTTSIDGGGMYNRDNSSPMVTNCTFSGNIAIDGGGMCNRNNSSPMVANCILWSDSPDEIFDEPGSSTTVTYSDVQGGWPGTGNIDADPLFADADGRLLDGSPCIDAGNDAAVPPSVITDLDGNPRIQGARVDMGAFESEFTAPDFSGWIWMESESDFGYSQDEDDLLYFLSFGPVWYYNTATSLWSEEGPVGWTYVNWPFLYESATDTTIFALPPDSGLWVYHFRPGQWTVSPRIIP